MISPTALPKFKQFSMLLPPKSQINAPYHLRAGSYQTELSKTKDKAINFPKLSHFVHKTDLVTNRNSHQKKIILRNSKPIKLNKEHSIMVYSQEKPSITSKHSIQNSLRDSYNPIKTEINPDKRLSNQITLRTLRKEDSANLSTNDTRLLSTNVLITEPKERLSFRNRKNKANAPEELHISIVALIQKGKKAQESFEKL